MTLIFSVITAIEIAEISILSSLLYTYQESQFIKFVFQYEVLYLINCENIQMKVEKRKIWNLSISLYYCKWQHLVQPSANDHPSLINYCLLTSLLDVNHLEITRSLYYMILYLHLSNGCRINTYNIYDNFLARCYVEFQFIDAKEYMIFAGLHDICIGIKICIIQML